MGKKVRLIVFIAALAALSIVTNVFTVVLYGNNSLSFTYLTSFIAGIFLGPIGGVAVGLIGDGLGHLIAPKGAFNPYIFVSAGLIGLIPGLVFKFFRFVKSDFIKLLISYVLCFLICTAFLNTYGLWLLYSNGRTFWVYFLVRVPLQLIMIIANFAATFFIMHVDAIKKFFLFMHTNEPKNKKNTDNKVAESE